MESLLKFRRLTLMCIVVLTLFGAFEKSSTLSASPLPMESAALNHFAPKIVARRPKAERKVTPVNHDQGMRKMHRRIQGSWFKRLFLKA